MFASLHIYCPDDLKWKPSDDDFQRLLTHFSCDKFQSVSVEDPYEDEPLDCEFIDFKKDVASKDYKKYFKKAKSYVVFYSLVVPEWSQQFDECTKYIDPSIMCDWVPWGLGVAIGKQSLPDSYNENPLYECYFSVSTGGDGYPLDLVKCNDEISSIEPVKDIFRFLKTLNNKQWISYISCSF